MDTATRPTGRPRRTLQPTAPAPDPGALQAAGAAYAAARADMEEPYAALVAEVERALLGGMHYIDVAATIGLSKKMPWRILQRLRAEGHPLEES